jgi:predicted nucleic acid-binding protein
VAWAYVDTSAMVKRYLDEQGHREVVRLLRRHDLVSSALLPVELRSAFRRRVLDRSLEAAGAESALRRFAADRAVLTQVGVTDDVLARAEALVASQAIRTLDAIHVGSAQFFAARLGARVLFVSADTRQTDVAGAVGLSVAFVGPGGSGRRT